MKHIITEKEVKSIFNKREKDCNKGNFGYVGVMGGCPSYSGAVKLANMAADYVLVAENVESSVNTDGFSELAELSKAALRSGCGVSRLIVPQSIEKSVAPYLLESTLYSMPCDENGMMKLDTEAFVKLKALSIGMGWGQSDSYEEILKYILKTLNLNLIIDADGLNTLSKMSEGKELLNQTKCSVVLTPHLMEFSRLSGYSIDEIKEDRIKLAKEFANKYHVILLLKGAETIVTDGEEVVICDRGTPGMATAGSGDVLSGILTGMLGYLPVNVETVASAAYINGYAGELAANDFTEISMTAGDTVSKIPEVFKKILGVL